MGKFYTSHKRDIFSLLIIFCAAFLSFSNSFTGSFVFDDRTTIVDNPSIKNIYDIRKIFTSFPARFLPNLTNSFNYFISGSNTFTYHLINFIIHVAAAFAVYWFVSLLTRRNNWFPFVTALFFVSHPIQTQAVSYISQRATLLAAFFFLLSLCFYLKANASKGKFLIFYFAAILSQTAAHFSKENTFTLPFFILLTDFVFISKSVSMIVKRSFLILPFFAVSFLIYTNLFQNYAGSNLVPKLPSAASFSGITRTQYLLTQPEVIVTYIKLLALPVGLNADYDFPVAKDLQSPGVAASLFLLFILFAFAVFTFKKNRLFSYGVFFFFTALFIESSVIPIDDVINEHRLYLPSVGFFISLTAVIFMLSDFLKKSRVRIAPPIFTIFILVNYLLLTFQRNNVWQSEYALWQDVVKKSPQKSRGHYNLGMAYLAQNQLDKGINELTKALRINNRYIEAYNNIAGAYRKMGKLAEAEKYYRLALEIDPHNIFVINNLALLYLDGKREEEAISLYKNLLGNNITEKEAYNGLGVVYFKLGKLDLAFAQFQKAAIIDPLYADPHLNLAVYYKNAGRLDEAAVEYLKVVELDYGNSAAYYNLGLIYLRGGKLDRAFYNTKKAIIFNRDYTQAYNSLGVIYAKQGKIQLAADNFKKALEIEPNFIEAKNNLEKLPKDAIQF